MSRHGRGRDRGLAGILGGLGLGALSFGGAAAAIGATWKVTEVIVKSKQLFQVRGENAVFVRLIDSVKIDLRELDRLMALKEVKEALRHNKGKTLWIKAKVDDMNAAIGAMEKYTRKVAGAGWWLGLKTRLWWILDEHEKLLHREMELSSAKEGILAAIEYLNQFENNPEKRKEEHRSDTRHTTITKNVDVDIDVDVDKRGRRVIELDRDGRPIHEHHHHHDDYIVEEEDIRVDSRPFRVSERDGFYDGRLDGPLSTRPSWWSQRYGVQGDEYIKRTVVEEKVETEVPLRVHWPTKL